MKSAILPMPPSTNNLFRNVAPKRDRRAVVAISGGRASGKTLSALHELAGAAAKAVKAPSRVRTDEYNNWIRGAGLILNAARLTVVAGPCVVTIRLGQCNEARDLDNFAKPVLDLLVKCAVLRDDNLRNLHELRILRAFGDVAAGHLAVSVAAVDAQAEASTQHKDIPHGR